MALLFCSSCGDVYTVALNTGGGDANLDWTSVAGNTGTFETVPGRNGNGFGLGAIYMTLPQGSQPTLCVGFAMKMNNFSNDLVTLANTFASLNFQVLQVGDGRIFARLNVNNSIDHDSPPSTFRFNSGQFYYIEVLAQQSFSGGVVTVTFDVHVNENSVLSGSLSATPGPATGFEGTFASVEFLASNSNVLDDVTCTDGEFLGDVAIGVLFPRLDGDLIQWLPSTPGTHFNLVNEHTPDFDATYVQTPTVGNIDQYFLDQIIGFSGTIKGARLLLCVKKTDTGLASVQGVYKSGGGTTVLTGGDFYCSDSSYIYAWYPTRFSVFTGLNWTPTEVNAAQFGIKRTN